MTGLRKFRSKIFCFVLAALAFSIAITCRGEARCIQPWEIYSTLTTDTLPHLQKNRGLVAPPKDTLPPNRANANDTTGTFGRNTNDTAGITDTLPPAQRVDTFSLKLSKDTLDAPVNYEAEDSAVLLVKEKKLFLYGKTKTTYKDVTLTAPKVEFDQQTSIVTAYNSRDSLGNTLVRARFQQGQEQSFESDTITYNFKTQRGLTKNTYTKQQEMWVQANLIKKVNANTTFAKHVIMTTCDYDEPHFGFVSSKGKFINNKIAVTGPIHPEFEGVPIPVYLPFGIFPLNPGRHSGLLPPQFTVNEQFGLGLTGLGYYKVMNQYWDVTFRSDIYSYGGWNLYLTPTYRKRYRYNGSFNLSLQRTKINFKGDPDYSLSKTFNIAWSHNVDSRAKPGTTFGANVNFGSTKFNQYIPDDPRRNITNTQTSSINYSKVWSGATPLNLTLSANQSQYSSTHLMNVTLPDVSFSVATFYPFQRKEVTGQPKWYEKIGLGYTGTGQNQIAFYDTAANTVSSLLDTLEWGARHSIPISLTLPPLGKLMVSPSVSYEESWLMNRIRRRWNDVTKKVDTVSVDKGFFTDRHMGFALSLNTTLYGLFPFKKGRIEAIRHVVRPQFSISYTPNLSKNKYDVIQSDTLGHVFPFSQFENNRLSTHYGYGRFGGISFGIDNNLEMKVHSKKDTAGAPAKRVSLIDGFGFTSAYNFLQDSMRLSPFSLNLRSTLFEKLSLTASAILNPYQVDSLGQYINRMTWQDGHFSPGHITTASITMSTRFQSKPRDPNKAPNPNAQLGRRINDPTLLAQEQLLQDYIRRNPADFVDFNIPWSIDFSFSFTLSRGFDRSLRRFRSDVTSSLSFNNSFSLTPKWNFTTNGYYDFRTSKITQFAMSVSRDMHCWQMSISVVPVNTYRSFSITISPKSSILQDLKVNRTRTFSNY